MKIKNSIFLNPHLRPALDAIGNSKLKAVEALKVHKVIKEVLSNKDDFEATKAKVISDNNGELSKEESRYKFPDDESEEKVNSEILEMGESSIDLSSEKIKLPESIELTVNQVGAVSDLFEF